MGFLAVKWRLSGYFPAGLYFMPLISGLGSVRSQVPEHLKAKHVYKSFNSDLITSKF
jgi:hypothetical protein